MNANYSKGKRGKKSSYSAKEKLNVVKFALENNQAAAARKFSVHKSMVSRWVQDVKRLELADPTAKRITTPSCKMTTSFMGGDEAPKRMRKRNRVIYYSSSDSSDSDSSSLCLTDSSEDGSHCSSSDDNSTKTLCLTDSSSEDEDSGSDLDAFTVVFSFLE